MSTSTPCPASASARARTFSPNNATRTGPPDRDASSRPMAIASKVDGAMRPSRCSAKISRSPAIDSPPCEAFVPQELCEFLRLFLDGPGDHIRVAFRGGRRQPADAGRVGKRGGIPRCEAEGRGGELLDLLARRLPDRRERRVPRRVRAQLNPEGGGEGHRAGSPQSPLPFPRD